MNKTNPIIMQDFSIQGIRKGAKTETRRLTGLNEINKNPDDWEFMKSMVSQGDFSKGRQIFIFQNKQKKHTTLPLVSKYGQKGDELWVRETWCKDLSSGWKSPLFMPKAASRITLLVEDVRIERLQDITEEGAIAEGIAKVNAYGEKGKMEMWQIHCPTVPKSVKFPQGMSNEGGCSFYGLTAVAAYKTLWISMHGQESWDLNPFVWVVKFSVKEFKM